MKPFVPAAVCAILSWVQVSYAQPPDSVWTQTFGGALNDYGAVVQQTNDDGYVIVGTISEDDVYLIKTDSGGDVLWTQTFGGALVDVGASVQQTTDGGFIVAGWTYSFGAGGKDVYLVKTDSGGSTLWTQTFGGAFTEGGFSVKQTTDSGYIITGYTHSFGAGMGDVYLIKTDSSGNIQWTQTFGGANPENGYSVQQTTDGGYIVTGYTLSYGAGNSDVYLIKTDSSGNTQWMQTFGGAGYDVGRYVQQTTDCGYIVAGTTESFGAGSRDVYLIKTDSGGEVQWTQTFGGTGTDHGCSVQQTTDSGYIVSGSTTSYGAGGNDVYLIKTDSSGEVLWTQTFGGSDEDHGGSVQQTTDGGYITTGSTSSYGAGGIDVYLIKLESETGIEEENEGSTPLFILESVDPNPFSSELSITYNIPEQTWIDLAIFDLSGRLVEDLISNPVEAGEHSLFWNPAPSISNGCYLIVLDACGKRTIRRAVLLR
jgi:hypothetical protein